MINYNLDTSRIGRKIAGIAIGPALLYCAGKSFFSVNHEVVALTKALHDLSLDMSVRGQAGKGK